MPCVSCVESLAPLHVLSLPLTPFTLTQFLKIYEAQFALIDSAFVQMADFVRAQAPKGQERLDYLDVL